MDKPFRRPRRPLFKSRSSSAFTIVELLVVVVVIAILAAITIVAYTGVTGQAVASSLQSDLNNASTQLKIFQAENSNYPTTISTDCTANPDSLTNKCLKITNGNYYIGYSANNSVMPKAFSLFISNSQTTSLSSQIYKITGETAPTKLASTMQPSVTPGAVLELHAAKATNGTNPGVNSPATATWYDTSGSGNNGTLTNMAFAAGSGWQGSGSLSDPFSLSLTSPDDYVSLPTAGTWGGWGSVTAEIWASASSQAASAEGMGLNREGAYRIGFYHYAAFMRVYSRIATTNNAWTSTSLTGSNNLSFGVMHHLVAVYDSAAGTLTCYTDGASAGQLSGLSGAILNGSSGTINRFGPAVITNPWNVASARIYPFALTATQVAANYAAGPTW